MLPADAGDSCDDRTAVDHQTVGTVSSSGCSSRRVCRAIHDRLDWFALNVLNTAVVFDPARTSLAPAQVPVDGTCGELVAIDRLFGTRHLPSDHGRTPTASRVTRCPRGMPPARLPVRATRRWRRADGSDRALTGLAGQLSILAGICGHFGRASAGPLIASAPTCPACAPAPSFSLALRSSSASPCRPMPIRSPPQRWGGPSTAP